MSMTEYYRATDLPWTTTEEDEERFRRILRRSTIVFLVFALVFPLLPLPKVDRAEVEELPPRFAKLMLERQQPPAPEPIRQAEPEQAKPEPRAEKPKPKEVKKPPVNDVQAARRKAERSGLLAFRDDLADLRSDPTVASLSQTKTLKQGGGTAAATTPDRSVLTSSATRASGGINTSRLSRDTGGAGLAGRDTTRVDSPVGGGASAGRMQRGGSRKAGRSVEEVGLVFDRNKSAIYSLYNRELRNDPGLQGKVVLKITISASGKVLACQVVSSELHSKELERKIAARVMLFDFGAKDADVTVVNYTVDFLPS